MGNHFKMSGCCNDKQISASIYSDQQAATKYIQANNQSVITPVFYTTYSPFTSAVISVERLARGAPDLPQSIPLFVKNCVFRI